MTQAQIKRLKLQKWDRIETVWEDATGWTGADTADEILAGHQPALRRSIGFFVGARVGSIITTTTDDRQSSHIKSDSENYETIPFGMIVSIEILKKEAGSERDALASVDSGEGVPLLTPSPLQTYDDCIDNASKAFNPCYLTPDEYGSLVSLVT